MGTFFVVDTRRIEEEGLDRVLQVRVTEKMAEEVVEWHLEEDLQIAAQVFDEMGLFPTCNRQQAHTLDEEVLRKHSTEEKTVGCIVGDDSIAEKKWINRVIDSHDCGLGYFLLLSSNGRFRV